MQRGPLAAGSARDGKMWTTMDDVAVIDPATMTQCQPPPVMIKAIIITTKRYRPRHWNPHSNNPGQENFEVSIRP
jgi:hypothetical protein